MTLAVDGIKSSAIIVQIDDHLKTLTEAQRKEEVKKVKGIFVFNVKNKDNKVATWTLDLKNGAGAVGTGVVGKGDITIDISDDDFIALSEGKANGQKLFMAGKIKAKGNVMLATKLETVLKGAQAKAKL
ncbi:SCP2 sterol-binding domain-containing protein [Mortierella sp. GBAus27b]|nr:hypothetical protein BGX31_007926 [Mortierella sp. GBA43]KAI8346479.1 SCP2 sterol-binding domain-containing protein [Mortierella sp. GBAus27b]